MRIALEQPRQMDDMEYDVNIIKRLRQYHTKLCGHSHSYMQGIIIKRFERSVKQHDYFHTRARNMLSTLHC